MQQLETTQLPSAEIEDFDWRNIVPADRYNTVVIPDRLSVEPASEWHCPIFMRRVAVFCNGVQVPRVIEYCMSEGWVRQHRIPSGKVRVSKNGSVVAFKRQGKVTVKLIGELKGRVSYLDKEPAIVAVLVRYDDQTEFPCGRVAISDLTYQGQPVDPATLPG